MKNTQTIIAFLDSVKNEAEAEARRVYEKKQIEFENLIRNSLPKDWSIKMGNGAVILIDEHSQINYDNEKVVDAIKDAVFYTDIRVNFSEIEIKS